MAKAKAKKAGRRIGGRTAALAAAGIGIAAAAAAAVLLSSPYGKPVRKNLAKAVSDIRRSLAPRVAKAKRLTRETYHELVRTAVRQYRTGKNMTQKDVDLLVRHLQGFWKDIIAQKKTSAPKRAARRTSR